MILISFVPAPRAGEIRALRDIGLELFDLDAPEFQVASWTCKVALGSEFCLSKVASPSFEYAEFSVTSLAF